MMSARAEVEAVVLSMLICRPFSASFVASACGLTYGETRQLLRDLRSRGLVAASTGATGRPSSAIAPAAAFRCPTCVAWT